MAVVYLAEDLKHHRKVAIKVLRPELSAAMGPERFLREIEIAAQLNHPNILALHDSGEADGVLYFVMPFVEGESLRDRLEREGQLSLDDAVRITSEVASALGYAHERGVVHRDIKPENILFQAGHALVCDFGIAKAASEAQGRLTETGLAVGTLKYMSPEQWSGRATHLSDQYALGIVAYRMLSGEVPFKAETMEVQLKRQLFQKPEEIRALRPDCPEDLASIVMRMLEKEPAARWQDIDQAIGSLESRDYGRKSPARLHLAALARVGHDVKALPRTPTSPLPKSKRSVAAIDDSAATAQTLVTTSRTPPSQPPRTADPLFTNRRSAGGGRPPLRLPLTALAVLAAVGLGYRFDLGGVRSLAETRMPELAGLPLLGTGRVYATGLDYPVVEGGADIESDLRIALSGPVDALTASGINVKLLGPDDAPLSAEVTVDAEGSSLSVRPLEPLAYETDYRIEINAGLLSLAGNPVFMSPRAESPGASFSFRTRNPPPDTEAPALAASTPAAGGRDIPIDEPLTLSFSEKMEPTTVNDRNIKLIDDASEEVEIAVLMSADITRAQIQPAEVLQPGAGYTIELSEEITDAAGNPLPAQTIPFTTKGRAARVAQPPALLSVRVLPQEAMELVRFELDGKDMGSVPKLNISISSGRRHTVKVIAQAPMSSHTLLLHEQSFTASANQKVDVAPTVRPFGIFTVTAEPAADVFIDGKYVGVTPLAGYPLPAGEHALELHPAAEADSYSVHKASLSLGPFERKSLGLIKLQRR